jgi:pyruvate formate lyase activating enzyme
MDHFQGRKRFFVLLLVILFSGLILSPGLKDLKGEIVRTGATPRAKGITPRPALYWKSLVSSRVQCELCPRKCVIPPGKRGICQVRENRDGKLYTLVYSLPCAVHADPIEKKPLFHVLPGTKSFSIATAGCNLQCKFCQNWNISRFRPEDTDNYYLPPEEVVKMAERNGCSSIAYTYSEPTIFYEYMLATAKLAHKSGLMNVMHSAGYINEEPLRVLCKHLDAANIDLKAFTDEFYRQLTGGHLAPVLRTLKILKEEGVHTEITTLIIPTKNDSPEEIRKMCKWIADNLGEEVPLHFSRFWPQYKLANLSPTPIKTLETAKGIAREEGLKYVYIGNVPGHKGENTYCPHCYKLLVRRIGYQVWDNNLSYTLIGDKRVARCKFCAAEIAGVWKLSGTKEEPE